MQEAQVFRMTFQMKKPILPPTYLLIAMLILILLHFVLPLGTSLRIPWNLVGLAPLIAGVVLNLVADRAFKQRATTVKPFEPSTVLITEGAFAISRHPMYLGFVLILIGLAMLLGSISPYIVVIPFAILMEVVFIGREEQMMAEQFGEDWKQYKARVRRWI